MHGFGPPKPKEILRAWGRGIAVVLGIVLLIWAIFALRSRPPVDYKVLTGEAPGLNDGSWDYFAAVAVDKNTSKEDLRELLKYFQNQYIESEYDRVRIVVFNNRAALLTANMDALVAEYRQDREHRDFTKEIVE